MSLRTPLIYTHVLDGMPFTNLFGGLGTILYLTGHHTAGAVDTSDRHAMQMAQAYHREHRAKGWGGIGYHFMITRKGNIICLRPVAMKGAHVGMHNSNNLGVVMCGTVGNKPSLRQRRAYQWLRRNAHTTKMPTRHRTNSRLTNVKLRGHNDWPGHETNSCPGTFKPMYRRGF